MPLSAANPARGRTGLVLEGGGLRALFSAGVLDVFMEHGLTFGGMVGVSAGATIGINFKSGQVGRALRFNLKYGRDPRYISLRNLLREGNVVGTRFAYDLLPRRLDVFDFQAFARNPMEFVVVCTDVATATPFYHKLTEIDPVGMDWLRATASLPVLSRPVAIDGAQYLDGGLSDSIPLRYFESQGYGRNIVILTQPRGYQKRPMPAPRLCRLLLRKHPLVARAMARRHEMYNAQLSYLQARVASGHALVICPQAPLPIGRLEKDEAKMREAYHLGRTEALARLAHIQDFISQ